MGVVDDPRLGGLVPGLRDVPAAQVPGPAPAAAFENFGGAVTSAGALDQGSLGLGVRDGEHVDVSLPGGQRPVGRMDDIGKLPMYSRCPS